MFFNFPNLKSYFVCLPKANRANETKNFKKLTMIICNGLGMGHLSFPPFRPGFFLATPPPSQARDPMTQEVAERPSYFWGSLLGSFS